MRSYGVAGRRTRDGAAVHHRARRRRGRRSLVDLLAVGLRRPALAGLPMLAIYSVPVAVYVDSVPALPFVVGAAGFLWLLVTDNVDRVRRFGRRFTGDGRDVDVWEPSPLAAAGRRLGVVGVALARAAAAGRARHDRRAARPAQPGRRRHRQRRRRGRQLGPDRPVRRAQRPAQPGRGGRHGQGDHTEPSPFYLRFGVADELAAGRLPGAHAQRPAGQPGPARPGRPGRPGRAADQPTRPPSRSPRASSMPLLPVYAEPIEHRRPRRQLVYDPDHAGRLLQPGQLPGQEVLVRLRPLDVHAGGAARAPQPLPADDPVRRQLHRRRRPVPRGRRAGQRADPGQDAPSTTRCGRSTSYFSRGQRLHATA